MIQTTINPVCVENIAHKRMFPNHPNQKEKA